MSASAEDKDAAAEACKDKQEGDACTFIKLSKPEGGELQRNEVAGTCQPDQCCKLDYSKGSPPDTTCGPCVVCKEGSAYPTPPIPEPTPDSGAEPPRAGDEPPASAGNDKRGCSVGAPTDAGWSVLLLLWLLALPGRTGHGHGHESS
jgi:hypothetical protein